MGYENDKTKAPPPYDPNGNGFVGEGRGAKEAPIKDADDMEEAQKENTD